MRILVTGSRNWEDTDAIVNALSRLCSTEPVTLVHGGCPLGADAIVNDVAQICGWTIERYPANWREYGKAAGYRRNAEMVKRGADICLAFIKDGSRGATMCSDLAEKAGIPVERICK